MNSLLHNQYQQLCDVLKEIEHHSDNSDELFYCSYILSLLGLMDLEQELSFVEFGDAFLVFLRTSMQQENITQNDQDHILQLWKKVVSLL